MFIEIYHRICFPLYKTKYIKRKNHIIFDRHRLKYLNFFQKCYCTYCSYGNGIFSYWKEIAEKTEKYWCEITSKKVQKYQKKLKFSKYKDKEDFEKKYKLKK